MESKSLKSSYLFNDLRFDSSYHLNQNAIYSRSLEENREKCCKLSDLATVFNPPIFKRQFCQKTEKSVDYCQSNDVATFWEGSSLYINGTQAEKVGAIVKENQILITGFGTIGNLRLVNELCNGTAYANNVCRVEPHNQANYGYLYAFLSSKYGKAQLNKNGSGSVVRYIEAPGIRKTLVPELDKDFQLHIHELIMDSTRARVSANKLKIDAISELLSNAQLPKLTPYDYEFFGNQPTNKDVSAFVRNIKELSEATINAFNYSKRIRVLIDNIKEKNNCLELNQVLDRKQLFSTGSFPRLEINSPNSIKLINQSDIFNHKKVGKFIARKNVKTSNLVEYGEVLIAAVGTLGENETFCKVVFANEELSNQLVSGEFIRMRTIEHVPPGYLYAWLQSDYGFRLIRSCQTGTKLCRPIQYLLKKIPVPILDITIMESIDNKIKKAHTLMYQSLQLENTAIRLIENEIDTWQN